MSSLQLASAEESYRIVGACFEVHNRMGCGFLEDVYQECLAIEFGHQQIPFIQKPEPRLVYRGHELKQMYKPDFLCFGSISVEIKAVDCLSRKFRAQVLNYLNATGFQLGLLVNFAAFPKLEHERIVRFEK